MTTQTVIGRCKFHPEQNDDQIDCVDRVAFQICFRMITAAAAANPCKHDEEQHRRNQLPEYQSAAQNNEDIDSRG